MRCKFCLLVFLITIASSSVSAIANANENLCEDIAIVFARGSGQNQGSQYLDDVTNEKTFGGAEKQSYTFFKEISSRFTGISVEKISLHNFEGRYNPYGYQAVDVAYGFTHGPEHRKDVPNRYYESVADGAEELAWFLEDRLTSCPFQQIILGGYSQGAHVVGDAMFKIKPQFRPRIGYVALFGDPKFNPRTSSIPIIAGNWARGTATSTQTGALLARKNYLPDEIVYRGSWCDSGDPICANYSIFQNSLGKAIYDLFLVKVHQENYQNKWIGQAANEIAMAIKARAPSFAGNIQTATWVNKNDKLYQLDLAIVIDSSGSMVDEFASIKKRLDAFSAALFNSYWDARIGIVVYNDDYAWAHTYFSKKLLDFSYSKDSVKTVLQSLKAELGGDEPECMYSGLMTAMNELSWRQGAQKKILVIADAPAHNPDRGPEHWTKEQVVKRALELDPVSINFVKLPTASQGWKVPYTNHVNYLALNTNGLINEPNPYVYDSITTLVSNALTSMDTLPVAAIEGEMDGFVNEPLYLSGGGSYDPDSVITSYSWDCNNDGVWEIVDSDSSIAACSYANPYTGFVVLEVKSSDSGSAKATLMVNILEDVNTLPGEITKPNASYRRGASDVTLTWDNDYSDDITVLVRDEEDNLLGYGSDGNFLISEASQSAFNIVLAACSGTICSEDTLLEIAAAVQEPEIEPDKQLPFDESWQAWILFEKNKKQVQNTSVIQNTIPVILTNYFADYVDASTPEPIKTHITQVEGVQNVSNPAAVNVKNSGINYKPWLGLLVIIFLTIETVHLLLKKSRLGR